MSDEQLREQISESIAKGESGTYVNITGTDGNTTRIPFSEAKTSYGLGDDFLSMKNPKVNLYRTSSGSFTTDMNKTNAGTVSFNEETGDITIVAPTEARNNEIYQNFKANLDTYAANYKANKDWQVPITDANGQETGETQTLKEYVDELNKQKEGTDGQTLSDVQRIISVSTMLEANKNKYKETYKYIDESGEIKPLNFTNADLILRSTVATDKYVDKVTDSTLQAVPQWFYDKYLAGKVTSYDSEVGTLTQKDLQDNWYNREKTTTEERASSFIELGNWIQNAQQTLTANPEKAAEIMKAEALYEYMAETDPVCSFWQGVGDVVVGAPLKAATSIITGLGEGLGTAATWITEKQVQVADFVNSKLTDSEYHNIEFTKDAQNLLEDARQKAIKWAQYAGSGDWGFAAQSLTNDTYAQTLTGITTLDYNENKAYTAISGVMEFVGNMALIISVGNAVAEAATGAVAGLASKASATAAGIAGDALAGAWGLENTLAVTSGTAQMLTSILGTESTVSLLNVAVTGLNSGIAITTASLVGETLGEALVGDPVRFAEILASEDTLSETKEYLYETFLWNALGRGGEQFFFEVGNTPTGRAISTNWRQRVYAAQSKAADIWDTIRNRLSKYEDLQHRIAGIEEAAAKLPEGSAGQVAKSRKAQTLRQQKIIRDVRDAVASGDKIQWLGKDKEEILEQLAKADSQLSLLTELETELDDFLSQVRGQKNLLRNSAEHPIFRDANTNIVKTNEALLKAEQAAKMQSAGLTNGGALMSNKTNQYINDQLRLKIAQNKAASGYKGVAKEAVDKEIEHYTNAIIKYINETNPEVVKYANQFADELKTWYQTLNDVKLELGVVDEVWLADKRASDTWGKGGADYARLQRKQETNKYLSIRTKPGADTEKLYEELGHYGWGSTDEFVDPMLVMEMELTNTAEIIVRNNIVKTYSQATGSATVLKTAEQVRIGQDGARLIQEYTKSAAEQITGLVESINIRGIFLDILERRQQLDVQTLETFKSSGVSNRQFRVAKPTTGEAKTVVNVLADNAVEGYSLNDLFTIVYEQGSALGLTGNWMIVNGRVVTQKAVNQDLQSGLTRWAKEQISDLYAQGLTNTKGLSEENLGILMQRSDFDIKLKRFICATDTKSLTSKPVREVWEELAAPSLYAEYWRTMEGEYVEHMEAAAKASLAAGLAESSVRDISYEVLGEFKQAMRQDDATKQLLKRMTDVYGKEYPDAVEEFVLSSSLKSNKKALLEELDKVARKEFEQLKIDDEQVKTLIKDTKNLVADMVDKDFSDARKVLAEADDIAKQLIDVDNWHKEIYDAARDLGATLQPRNVILMPGEKGGLEAVKIDPLLAEFITTKVPSRKSMNVFEKANYLWMKLWRLGTTGGVTGRSITNQYLRDMGNAWVMGNVTHLIGTSEDLLAEIFGANPAHYLSSYAADAQEKFLAEAAQKATAEGISEQEALGSVLAAAESTRGALTVASATESETMKLLRQTRGAWTIGGTTQDDFGKMANALDKAADFLNRIHNVREDYLRNVVYMNNLNKALERNLSLEQARSYALYVSNNATTNFARATTFMSSLVNTVPYLRATINGTKSFWRLWSLDPVGVTGRIIGGFVVPTIGLITYSLLDEDNRKVYKNFKEYEKDSALCFVVDGQAFSIPIPQEIGTFIAPIRQAIEAMEGQNKSSLWELAINDILGFSPLDLSGFTDVDGYRMLGSDGSWTSRLDLGISRLFSQIAPRYATGVAMAITGKDLFTGKSIQVNDVTIDPLSDDTIPIDYTSGTFAKTIQKIWPNLSANIAQEVLENIGGTAGVQVLDWFAELGLAVTGQQSVAEALTNVAEDVATGLTAPLTPTDYDTTQTAWNNAISRLYAMKNELLASRAWSDYQALHAKAQTTEQLQEAAKVRDNILNPFYDEVKTAVQNLRDNYGQGLSQAKYASVISLLNLELTTGQGSGSAWENKLAQQTYSAGRSAALATMQRLGFSSASVSADDHWFVSYRTNSKGETIAYYNSPVSILAMESYNNQAKYIHTTELSTIIDKNIGYDRRAEMYDERSKAINSKDYNKANEVVMQYNNEVITAIDPYIKKYGAPTFINNDIIMDYLNDWIIVPSDWETNNYGKYISASKLNKQDGFIKSYLKYLYGVK